jgi:hypothetical protein
LILLAAAFAGTILLFLFNPGEHSFYPFCLFYRTTGLLCPGCGCLRAAHQLLHGNIAAACRFNALFVCSLPLLCWALTRFLVVKMKNPASGLALSPRWLWVGFAVLVVFGIIRNLPFAHALWLAP